MASSRYYIGEQPNQVLECIRDAEEASPAPFSSKPLLLMDTEYTLRLHPETTHRSRNTEKRLADVPIAKILGILLPTALSRRELQFKEGTTFRSVLFQYLHGASLNEDSVSYLFGDAVKHQRYPGFLEFPQSREYIGTEAYARRGIAFTKRADWYFADQGQQRAVLAMFAVFQRFGNSGVIRNVEVEASAA
jgi:hypothetical protein